MKRRLLATSAIAILALGGIVFLAGKRSLPQAQPDQKLSAVSLPADYDNRLLPSDTAIDSSLIEEPSINAGSQLILSVIDGETLAGMLSIADVPPNDIQAAVDAAMQFYDPRHLKTGQFVTVNFKPAQSDVAAPEFLGFELQADPETILTVSKVNAAFTAEQKHLTVRTEAKAAKGVIHGSLYEAAAEHGVPYSVTAAIIRAFSYDVDFQRDIQPGDRFKIMFDSLVTDGGSRPGDVLYGELILSGKVHAIYGVRREDGSTEFYTRDGKSVKRGLLKTPVDGARLTSGFGMRMHPILGYTRMHKGVDFGVPTGTPIYAAGDGVVEQSGWAGGYGRFVLLRHSPHLETAYGHMSRIAARTSTGQHIHQGEVIGYVGMTGDATGPHLHYEVRKDGSQVNPISITMPVSTGLEGRALISFLKTAEEREERFAALTSTTEFAAAKPN